MVLFEVLKSIHSRAGPSWAFDSKAVTYNTAATDWSTLLATDRSEERTSRRCDAKSRKCDPTFQPVFYPVLAGIRVVGAYEQTFNIPPKS